MIENPFCFEGGKHNRTPTQAHTSRYSLHLRHALEIVGLHRRYSLPQKIQCTSLRRAGACADERRTGVVAAEAAAAKGHCPWFGSARDGGALVARMQCAPLLGTERRALQLVVVQIKRAVSRRNRKLGNQLQGILQIYIYIYIYIHTHTSMHVGMYDCMRSESESELNG
jgi:hypothetical protein